MRLTFLASRYHRHGHREIGLARAGRPDAKHDVVLVDGVEIAALVRGLRRDAAFAGSADLSVFEEMIAEIDVGVFGDQLSGGLHVFVRDGVAFLHQAAQLFDEARHARRAAGIAFHHELMPLGADADVEEGFELAQVVVVGPEKRGHTCFRYRHLAHRRGAYSRISLRYKQLTANSHINTLLPVRSRSAISGY